MENPQGTSADPTAEEEKPSEEERVQGLVGRIYRLLQSVGGALQRGTGGRVTTPVLR